MSVHRCAHALTDTHTCAHGCARTLEQNVHTGVYSQPWIQSPTQTGTRASTHMCTHTRAGALYTRCTQLLHAVSAAPHSRGQGGAGPSVSSPGDWARAEGGSRGLRQSGRKWTGQPLPCTRCGLSSAAGFARHVCHGCPWLPGASHPPPYTGEGGRQDPPTCICSTHTGDECSVLSGDTGSVWAALSVGASRSAWGLRKRPGIPPRVRPKTGGSTGCGAFVHPGVPQRLPLRSSWPQGAAWSPTRCVHPAPASPARRA